MADRKIPSLNTLPDPQSDDLLLIVDDVTGTPVNKKITLGSLFNNFELLLEVIGKSLIKRDLNVRRDANIRNEGSVEQPVDVNVTGLNDISATGQYTGATSAQYDIEIESTGTPDKFKFRKDGGSYTTNQSASTSGTSIGDGLNIKFKATTGHTVGDRWVVTGLPVSRIDFGQGQLLQEDLVLDAADFSNEGFIVLESGIDIKLESGSTTDLSISSNTTSMAVNGPLFVERYNSETVSGDGSGTDAISLTTSITFLDTSGGTSTLTMGTGSIGQVKHIIMTVAGSAATLSQSNGNLNSTAVPTSIVFDAVGEAVTCIYTSAGWIPISSDGATIS